MGDFGGDGEDRFLLDGFNGRDEEAARRGDGDADVVVFAEDEGGVGGGGGV